MIIEKKLKTISNKNNKTERKVSIILLKYLSIAIKQCDLLIRLFIKLKIVLEKVDLYNWKFIEIIGNKLKITTELISFPNIQTFPN